MVFKTGIPSIMSLMLTIGMQPALADSFLWIGTDGDLTNPLNWYNQDTEETGLPGPGDRAIFSLGPPPLNTSGQIFSIKEIESNQFASTLTNSILFIYDSAWVSSGTLTQNGGMTVFGDEVNFTDGAAVTVTGGGVVEHQYLGDSDNRGHIFVTSASSFSLSGTGTTLDLTSGDGHFGDLNVLTGSQLNVSDQAAIQANTLQIEDASTATFNNATVTAGVLGLNAGSTATAAQGTQLKVLSQVGVTGGSTLTLQDSSTQMNVGNIEVGGVESRLSIESGATVNADSGRILEGELAVDNGVLNVTGTLRSGEAGTPSGTLALSNNAQLQVGGELFVDATLTAQDSTMTVAQRLAGTDGQVTLTGSSATVGSLEFGGNSTLNLTGTQLTIQGSARVSGGTLTQSGGSTTQFGDELWVTDGASLTSTGSSITQSGSGRGDVVIDNGTLILDKSSLNNTNGSQGKLAINHGGSLQASNNSNVNVNRVNIDGSSSQATFDNSALIAQSLYLSDGAFNLTGGTINVTAGDLKIDGGTFNAQTSAIGVSSRIEMLNNGQMLLNGDQLTVDGSIQVYSGSEVNSVASNVAVGTKLDVKGNDSSWLQSGGSTTQFGDELLVTDGASLTSTGSSITQSGSGRGDVVIDNGTLILDKSSLNNTNGSQGKLAINHGGSLQASNNSNVNVNRVNIDGADSKATFDNSTLTAQSLHLSDGGFFKATLSTINITGNSTTIDATSQMVLDGGTYNEAGDFTITGKLTGTNPVINIGSDLIINSGGSVDFSGLASLLIGDDLLFFGNPGTLNLGLTTITMQGLLDDDSDGFFQFDLGSAFSGILDLGKLIVGAVDLILKGNFNISELILPETATIKLAGNSTLTVSRFTGNGSSITGGTFYNNTPAVPEPTTLLLFGTGLLGLLGFRRFRKIG